MRENKLKSEIIGKTCLRFGLHWRVDTKNGVIPEGYAIFDLPGFFIQNGINLYERQNDPAYAVENYQNTHLL